MSAPTQRSRPLGKLGPDIGARLSTEPALTDCGRLCIPYHKGTHLGRTNRPARAVDGEDDGDAPSRPDLGWRENGAAARRVLGASHDTRSDEASLRHLLRAWKAPRSTILREAVTTLEERRGPRSACSEVPLHTRQWMARMPFETHGAENPHRDAAAVVAVEERVISTWRHRGTRPHTMQLHVGSRENPFCLWFCRQRISPLWRQSHYTSQRKPPEPRK